MFQGTNLRRWRQRAFNPKKQRMELPEKRAVELPHAGGICLGVDSFSSVVQWHPFSFFLGGGPTKNGFLPFFTRVTEQLSFHSFQPSFLPKTDRHFPRNFGGFLEDPEIMEMEVSRRILRGMTRGQAPPACAWCVD